MADTRLEEQIDLWGTRPSRRFSRGWGQRQFSKVCELGALEEVGVIAVRN